jgi:hypothetical protein
MCGLETISNLNDFIFFQPKSQEYLKIYELTINDCVSIYMQIYVKYTLMCIKKSNNIDLRWLHVW